MRCSAIIVCGPLGKKKLAMDHAMLEILPWAIPLALLNLLQPLLIPSMYYFAMLWSRSLWKQSLNLCTTEPLSHSLWLLYFRRLPFLYRYIAKATKGCFICTFSLLIFLSFTFQSRSGIISQSVQNLLGLMIYNWEKTVLDQYEVCLHNFHPEIL